MKQEKKPIGEKYAQLEKNVKIENQRNAKTIARR